MSQRPQPAAVALLCESVDDAGLFPPAGLGMAEAVAAYERRRRSGEAWLLGRFVVSASRLAELEQAARASLESADSALLPLAVLLSKRPEAELDALLAFCGRWPRSVAVRSLELPILETHEIAGQAARLPRGAEAYVEVAWGHDPDPQLDAVAAAGARAKARTGGLTPANFPSPRALAHLLVACHERRLAFKATGGLHHALRAAYRLGDEDAGEVMMHGFLNLAVAAALVHAGRADEAMAEAVLRDTAPRAFVFGAGEVAWRDLPLSMRALEASRRALFRSFAASSFEGPVRELRGLGVL